ncbi:hypothetical protein [Pseudodesulfovibrio indicus]|uniref:hypothetical protein n=1 Tax=Pseudodesulfovibrio indicus TaxID=1716143 RepID=UPI00292D263B
MSFLLMVLRLCAFMRHWDYQLADGELVSQIYFVKNANMNQFWLDFSPILKLVLPIFGIPDIGVVKPILPEAAGRSRA